MYLGPILRQALQVAVTAVVFTAVSTGTKRLIDFVEEKLGSGGTDEDKEEDAVEAPKEALV